MQFRGSKQAAEDRDILAFFREENEKNRAALIADSEANRKLLADAIKWISVPLTVLISVSAYLGWNSLDQVKKQGLELVNQVNTDERRIIEQALQSEHDDVQKRLDKEFAKDQLQNTVKEGIEHSKFVQETINTALFREKESMDEKVLKAVDIKTRLAVSKQIDAQQSKIEQMAQKMEGDVVGAYLKAARERADTRPEMRHPVEANVSYKDDFTLQVTATYINEGRFPAKNVRYFSYAEVVQTPRTKEAEQENFRRIARKIEEQYESGEKHIKLKVDFGEEMHLSATTKTPVAPFERDRLSDGNDDLEFMFYFQYSSSTGDSVRTPYCGVASGPEPTIMVRTCGPVNF